MAQAPCALVVDDNPMILMNAMEILEDAGFATFAAFDGRSALEMLEQRASAMTLLFTDVEMPGAMDGFQLARLTAERWPHIGIVVASGHVAPKDGDLPEGATFIGKPFSAEIVHGHIQKILPEGKKPEPLKRMS